MFMTKERFQNALKVAASDAVKEERKRVEDSSNQLEFFKLQALLNTLVICVSNEVSNVTVGFAKSIDFITQSNRPVLVVQDIVTKELAIPFGKVFSYTKQKFDALNSLGPNDRIAILYENYFEGTVNKSTDKHVYTSEEWAKIVNNSLKLWFNENEH